MIVSIFYSIKNMYIYSLKFDVREWILLLKVVFKFFGFVFIDVE